MREEDLKLLVKLGAGVSVACFFLLVLFIDDLNFGASTFRRGTAAVSAGGFSVYVFSQWAWRWGWVQKIAPRPVLSGTWAGRLRSSHVSEDGTPVIIKIVFVFRQTFMSISIRAYTRTMESHSDAVTLVNDADAHYVSYTYATRRIFGHIPEHLGAAQLRLRPSESDQRLWGTYWTSGRNAGRLKLRRVANTTKVTAFGDAAEQWSDDGHWPTPDGFDDA